jgi:serine/threonine protein kinase
MGEGASAMSSENYNEDFPNIPNYRIECEIDKGGMAIVYKGRHATLDRSVAIKLLKPDMTANSQAIDRFLREPKILARFSHPNIVTIYDSGFLPENQEQLYLVMEYLPGGSLKSKMRQGRIPMQRVIIIIKAIADALDLAHSKSVIHRDIKPDNILFRENGAPILTDFGIAKDLDRNTQMTAMGTLLGTYRYMSPEQFQGIEPDGRSDLFSLGILLVEMLTGERPFDGDSVEVLITKRLTDPVPELPKQYDMFQPIAERLLTKDREQRFADAKELIEALTKLEMSLGFVEPEAVVVAPAPVPQNQNPVTPAEAGEARPVRRRANRRWLVAGATVLVVVAATFAFPIIQGMNLMNEAIALVEKLELQDKDYRQQIDLAQGDTKRLREIIQDLKKEIETNRVEHEQTL